MKKTLVIHPEDETTEFLKTIYKDRVDWTIINSNLASKNEIVKGLVKHDRVIMLGHGTPHGLLGKGRFMIDSQLVFILREKECIGIWCNADQFGERYGLKSFFTGMIVSEEQEADMFLLHETSEDEIQKSNTLFAEAVRRSIDSPNIAEDIKKIYVGDSPVIKFNLDNINQSV